MRPAFLRPGGLVIVAEVLAIAASASAPALRDAAVRWEASRLVKDMDVVCTAASAAKSRNGEWPEDGELGRMPASLKPFLPPSFRFERGDCRFDWDHWMASDGSDPTSPASDYVAVSVVVADARLSGLIVRELETRRLHFTVGNRSTIMISEPIAPAPRSTRSSSPYGVS